MRCRLSFVCIILLSCFSCAYYPAEPVTGTGSVIAPSEEGEPDRIVVFEVVGKGIEPERATTKGQAILMAERSAIMDGYRLLTEKLRGTLIDIYSKRDNGEVNIDKITAQAQSYLRGVDIKEITKGEHGIYSAHMEVRVFCTLNNLIWWPTGLSAKALPVGLNKRYPIYYAREFTIDRTDRCITYPWCGEYYYHTYSR